MTERPMDLDRELIFDALLGTEPPHELMGEVEKLGLGRYTGGFHDRWDWDRYAVRKLEPGDALAIWRAIKMATMPRRWE